MVRPALSKFSEVLLDRNELFRFFMLNFDASIDRDPITATKDYLFDNADALGPNHDLLPDKLRLVYLRRVTHGKSPLSEEESKIVFNAMDKPSDRVVAVAQDLILESLSLTGKAPIYYQTLLSKLLLVKDEPKKQGRNATANANRNSVISSAVRRLIAAGLNKTGVETSACSVVSTVLCQMGYPVSSDGVRKIVDANAGHKPDSEEVALVRKKLMQGVTSKRALQKQEAWKQLRDIGKKLGYIPSNDSD